MARWQYALTRIVVGLLACAMPLTACLNLGAAPPEDGSRPIRIATELPRPLPPVETANPLPLSPEHLGPDLSRQTAAAAAAKSQGCISCHTGVGDMHRSPNVHLGCTDCHGGDANALTKQAAHVHPKECEAWPGSANPVRSYKIGRAHV